jgi:tetratricopeptide (TPR) repeat protein
MPSGSDQPRPEIPTATSVDRLDSWKEIAAFLGRDVRTVQRWEKHAGLPVHRHAESRLRTAFAYRSELDAWWQMQRATIESNPGGEQPQTPALTSADRSMLSIAIVAGAGVVLAAIGGAVVWTPSDPSPGQPIAVLLTRFDDLAGDPALAEFLEAAVATQIESHPKLEVVAPGRLDSALRLMRRDPATPVTATIGQEIAVRDGRIRFVLTGRLHRLESRYFLDLQVVEPTDGRVCLRRQSSSPSRESLRARVEAEAPAFLDEAWSIARLPGNSKRLERVTTSSFAALRLYTAAVQAGTRRQWQAAELLARRALAADDEFAAAYALVGWALRQQGQPARVCLPLLERAVHLSGWTTEQESYVISGAFHTISDNYPAAVAPYEALLRLQPESRTAQDLLIDAYTRAGRVKEAVELSTARAEANPGDFYATIRAAHALTIWHRDTTRAAAFIQRSEQLATPDARADRPTWGAWLSVLPVFVNWMNADIHAALERLAAIERTVDTRLGRERDALATMVGFAYLALGRIEEAERAFRQASSPMRQLGLATLALSLGRDAQARQWLLQVAQHSQAQPALFASAGLVSEAERGLEASFRLEHAAGIAEATRGLIASRTGRTDAAITSLQRATDLLRFSGELEYFLAADELARIRARRGEIDGAIRVLSDAHAQRARTYGAAQWTGSFWSRLNTDLAALYRRQGQHVEAERIDNLLRELLAEADVRHPLVRPVSAAEVR